MGDNAIMMWWPDTCECAIHLAYDDVQPREKRVLRYVTWDEAQELHRKRITAKTPHTNPDPQPSAQTCQTHAGVGPKLFEVLKEENSRRNIAFGLSQRVIGALDPEDFFWVWDKKRNLLVTLKTALSLEQRTKVQAALDIQFGPGRVKLSG